MVDYDLNLNVQFVEIKKSRFVKGQDPKGISSSLGIRTPLSKIPWLNILF